MLPNWGEFVILTLACMKIGAICCALMPIFREREIGFALHSAYQGKGLAAEAAREVLRLGFEELGLHRIVAVLVDQNTASARLLERLGMRREAHHLHATYFKGEWTNEYVYALLDDEWRAAQG